ncbi:hypothetical protein J2785_005299 [Burkholderia ambifaria]|nr:hypothetical protein [Burkholderia ambifaria]
MQSGSSGPSRRRNARRANASAARRLALRREMTIRDPGRGHPHAFAVHPRRPTGTGRPRASRMHAVVRNEPDCPDGTESRALTSPRSTAKRIPWQVGDSYLQHDTLRFGLFSFSCPRIRYVRPTEAIAGPDCACDRAHGTHRYARSAPCFMRQGRAGRCKAFDGDRASARNANVSKLKRPPQRRRAALPAGLPHRPQAGIATLFLRAAGSRLTIARQWRCTHDRTRALHTALRRLTGNPYSTHA